MKPTFKQLSKCIEHVNLLEELTPEHLHAIITDEFGSELTEGQLRNIGSALIKGATSLISKTVGGDSASNAAKTASELAKQKAIAAEKQRKDKAFQDWVDKEKAKKLAQANLAASKALATHGSTLSTIRSRDPKSASGAKAAERDWLASMDDK